jgi:phospholipid/cholesterol/gamma-HCH transport system substrate-binding protein
MLVFAATCVGLLLFLWLSFGGSLPFAAQGYRIEAIFPYADELANQSDVRISGVSVGDVVATKPVPGGGGVEATLQIDNKYAPIHADTRAILRTKTILGETYVELTPGTPGSPYLNDGAMLSRGHVVAAVQLDQIFNAFNGPTRKAFMVWQQELAQALKGNGQNLNDVIGNLPSFAANASDLLTVLDVQQSAVEQLIRGGAVTFAALDRDPAALTTLIKTGETTFAATAAQNKALAATFHNFPEFLKQSRLTLARLQTFANNTNPLISELEPVAQNLRPTLVSLRTVSPALEHFFVELKPLVQAAKTGLPATAKVLRGATPLLSSLGPWLEQLNPIIDWLAIHQPLLSDFISNGAAALNATTTSFGGGSVGHYLRQYSPVGPETEALMALPDPDNRGNAYPPAVWLNTPDDFKYGNFPSWDCYNTGAKGDGSEPANTTPEVGTEACWVAPTLPGAKPGKVPLLSPASYR